MDIDTFSRIDKLLVDAEELSPEQAQQRRAACHVHLVCGPDVIASRVLQAMAATILRAASRCFPGAVSVEAPLALHPLLLPEAGIRFGASDADAALRYVIVVGDARGEDEALYASFDGWTARVAPGADTRLPGRGNNPLAGILAGALAVSEVFLHFARITPEAAHRRVTLSLWQPGRPSPAAGPALSYLPSSAWLPGLGHLGQAYAWAFAWLPWQPGHERRLWLADDERIVQANVETGVLSTLAHVGDYKTRVVSSWLERQGAHTRMIERRLGPEWKVGPDEPPLMVGGVDRNTARHTLAGIATRLVDAGLGATARNFDTIAVRSWPNPRTRDDLWPLEVNEAAAEALVDRNRAYDQLSADRCGRVRLAQRAVGVPFVGLVAAAYAWSTVLRELHEGDHVSELRLKLRSPRDLVAFPRPVQVTDLAPVPYVTLE